MLTAALPLSLWEETIPTTGRITEVTRHRIVDWIMLHVGGWAGEIDETRFLRRLYDLDELPSYDTRFSTAAGDIVQHRVRNPEDWDDGWIFDDPRFELATSDERFLDFLAETLHPRVRRDTSAVCEMLGVYNAALQYDGYEIVPISEISGATVYRWQQSGQGVAGHPKNLIFAGLGAKPEIVIEDAINNDLRIVSGGDRCLTYDRPLPMEGLTWDGRADWWAEDHAIPVGPRDKVYSSLYGRLRASAANDAELRIFEAYGRRYRDIGAHIPALLPQVYLHYDPYTLRQRGGVAVLARQRMDFLMLCPRRIRLVSPA
jgi:hypothetical protein